MRLSSLRRRRRLQKSHVVEKAVVDVRASEDVVEDRSEDSEDMEDSEDV